MLRCFSVDAKFTFSLMCVFLGEKFSLMCVFLGGHPTETLPAEVQSGCFSTDIGLHLWELHFSVFCYTLLFCYTILSIYTFPFSAILFCYTMISIYTFPFSATQILPLHCYIFLLHNGINLHFTATLICTSTQSCATLFCYFAVVNNWVQH